MVLTFQEPLFYITMAPNSKSNDAGRLGLAKIDYEVFPLLREQKRKFLCCLFLKVIC